MALDVSLASAQTVLDRQVGLTEFDSPLILTKLDNQTVGTLAKAAGVAMGFEEAPSPPRPLSIAATKKPLRDVLDAIVAADRRYEWREDGDVILIRPVAAWDDRTSPLYNAVEAMTFRDVIAADMLAVVARTVGVTAPLDVGLADTRRFSVELREGGTLLDALNAIVRAHGALTWAITPLRAGDAAFPVLVSLFAGSSGSGFGIPIWAAFDSGGTTSATVARAGSAAPDGRLLERVVATRRNGRPIVAHGVSGSVVRDLGAAAGVPIGFERLPPAQRHPPHHPGFSGLTLTGLTLLDALAALVSLDPRYEWRDRGGVIVLRPATAWLDPNHPLFQLVGSVRLDDQPMSKAIGAFTTLFGAPEHTRNSFPDTRTFSVDVPQGSALDILDAFARSHGEMSWEWEELTSADRQVFGGRRYMVTFSVPDGGALGFPIP